MILSKVLLPIILLVSACSKSGATSSQDGGGSTDPGGTAEDDPKDVSGWFYLAEDGNPLSNSELLLVDWTDQTFRSYPISGDGSVHLELTEFQEGRNYSFHLISGFRKLGDLDLSEVNEGLQSVFEYHGGFGFELGSVVVPVDSKGMISVPSARLGASIGGGFSLVANDRDKRLEDLDASNLLSSLYVEPMLVVSRSDDLYYGFLNIVDPVATSSIRGQYTGIALRAEAADNVTIDRVFVSRLSPLVAGARVLPAEFSDISSASPWENIGYYLAQSATTFFADVLPGRDFLDEIVYLKIEGENPPQFELPRIATSNYTVPPVVTAVSMSGGAPSTVDYTDITAENGLTVPFCHVSGDIVISVSPPKDIDGLTVTGANLDIIELSFEYYGVEDGATVLIDTTTALSDPYDVDREDEEAGDYTISWTALNKKLTFVFGAGVMSATSHNLTIPDEVVADSLGSSSVNRIKVKLMFKSSVHPGKSGSVYWIKKDC